MEKKRQSLTNSPTSHSQSKKKGKKLGLVRCKVSLFLKYQLHSGQMFQNNNPRSLDPHLKLSTTN